MMVFAAFQSRLEALDAGVEPPAPAPDTPRVVDAADEAAQATIMMQKRLAALQKEVDRMKAEKAELAAAPPDMNLDAGFDAVFLEASLDEVPTIEASQWSEAELSKLGSMYSLLQTWQAQGGNTPFAFADLGKHSQAGAETQQLVQQILGPTWENFFPSTPASSDILPRQVVVFLVHGLEQLRASYLYVADAKATSAAALAELRDCRKRRRTVGGDHRA